MQFPRDVIHRGRAGIGMTSGDLDIAKRDADVQGGHDERGAQHVRVDPLQARSCADRAHPAVCRARVEPVAVITQQDRTLAALADRQVDRAGRSGYEWDVGWLVALADDLQDAMATFEAEVLDVRPAGLADAQTVQAEEHGQRGVHRRRSLGCVQERGQLAAVHATLCARVYPWPAHVLGRV
jgi:hypothetical protein